MMRLYIEDDAGNVRIVPLGEDTVTIGRAPDNSLVLADRNVSRHHARIRVQDGRLLLSDAGSRYGIRLDGERLSHEVEIRPGDVFLAGDYRLKVMAPDSALAESTSDSPEDRSRHATAVAMRAITVPEPRADVGNDFAMMTLQEMEEVARLGWRSDFDDDYEPGAGKRTAGRVLLLLVLVLMAVGLGFAYYKLYVAEDEVLVQPRIHTMPAPAPASRDNPPTTRRAPEPMGGASK
jgi:pSer/pThr/pTyr-binding forkhead associated (FHA) protein